MGLAESVVFVFGLWPDPDEVRVFRSPGEAEAHLRGYLFSESFGRILAPRKILRSQPIAYTIAGQALRPKRIGLLRAITLVPDLPDDAAFQVRLDTYSTKRGFTVPVVDRTMFADERMREMLLEQQAAPPPPLPGWLARRMPGPGPQD